MSNVRPRAIQMRRMLLRRVEIHRSAAVRGSSSHRLVKQQLHCIGAGRPSVGGRRTGSLCHGFLQHRLGLSVLWRPAHQRFGSEDMHRPNGGLCSAGVPSPEANTNTNTSLAWHSAVGAGLLIAEAAQRIKIRATPVLSHARPNPSVEGTCSSGLRPLPHAPHVKR